MANEGGKSFGQSGSKSGSSSGSRYGEVHGRGNPQGGSPRTMGIGSEKDFEKRGRVTPHAIEATVPSVANKAVTGKFFAREPEFNQMRDIKDAYQGYRPSKPYWWCAARYEDVGGGAGDRVFGEVTAMKGSPGGSTGES